MYYKTTTTDDIFTFNVLLIFCQEGCVFCQEGCVLDSACLFVPLQKATAQMHIHFSQ